MRFGSFLLLPLLLVASSCSGEEMEVPSQQMEMLVRTYPNFFVRKREEQREFIQRMQAEEYEKRYKIFEMAFTNILKMLEVEQKNLANYEHKGDTLPSTPKDFKAIVTIIENTCLVGEVVLHFPEISYRILDQHSGDDWMAKVEFGIKIVEHYKYIFDDKTLEMLRLFDQELNVDKRTEDFVNPYATKQQDDEEEVAQKKSKKKSEKRKKKKGPALQEL